LTPDPIGLEGGINLYAYVQNNPVNYFDPYGLVSAGQLGMGNPGSYGGDNTCESMYDERGPLNFADIRYKYISPDEIQIAEIPWGPGGIKILKAVNSNMPHAVRQGVLRGIFENPKAASDALKTLSKNITKNKGFPADAILDTARADRVLVPIGKGGMAVYQVAKNLTAKLKTVLIAR
jgi:hypothetical protein